ncbi:MAG: cysteine synthase A [Clostridiales bacterium]|nr:cysteine synthase A [Clostridiales bacterium]
MSHELTASVDLTIGDTPLVALRRLGAGLPGRIAIKLESRNPGGSVKDRIARGMIDDAEASGRISPGKSVLVEPTSGNTGIALAMIGAARGYEVVLTMPESMSIERRRLLLAYGAELVLTPAGEGMAGAVAAAEQITAERERAFLVGQFVNPANPRTHYETTGPEIEQALAAEPIGALVAGVGTGGTVSGAGRYLKERFPGVRVIAVEPAESPIISQTRAGQELTPGPHLIQGIGANFVPMTLDLGVLDEVFPVEGERALVMARTLAAEEGILGGISSGANVVAALEVAARPEMEGLTVVTFAPSTGERYLSTRLWEELG